MSSPSAEPSIGLISSLQRVFPVVPVEYRNTISLDAARQEKVSFQVVTRTEAEPEVFHLSVDAPAGISVVIRRVGFVPMTHLNTETGPGDVDGVGVIPGLVPDPLYPESSVTAGQHETNAFWVDLTASSAVAPGTYRIPIRVKAGDKELDPCSADLTVHKAILQERRDFPVTHWFYCDAIADFYKLKPFEPAFWPILEKYIRDLAEHGDDVMHTPVFTPPTDGVKRPNQLLHVTRSGDKYSFDWSEVKRFVELAKRCGMKRYEWSHFFSQWGCKNAIRIYEGDPSHEKLLWPADTLATAPVYRHFLEQFIPELSAFLDKEGIRDVSYFHISDEPHGDEALANYRAARKMMRELAPWMKFMDALSQISFAKEGLVDIPIPTISEAPAFVEAGYPAWCYFCCGPRGQFLNRLMDTPLTKIRMSGWLFYRLKSRGFLHWGYNYWYRSQSREMIDPFVEQAGFAWPGWAYGDPFVVYPGPDGPIDSIRWEVFAESLQDYALLQQAGVSPDDRLLADIHDYAKFPRSEIWIAEGRKHVLDILDRRAE